MQGRLGLPLQEVEHANFDRRRSDCRELYSGAARRRVGELFARDVDAFGYEF